MEMESYFLYSAIVITWVCESWFIGFYEVDGFYRNENYMKTFAVLIFGVACAWAIGAALLVYLLVPTYRIPILYSMLVQVYILSILYLRRSIPETVLRMF
jgi:hypothetical protein